MQLNWTNTHRRVLQLLVCESNFKVLQGFLTLTPFSALFFHHLLKNAVPPAPHFVPHCIHALKMPWSLGSFVTDPSVKNPSVVEDCAFPIFHLVDDLVLLIIGESVEQHHGLVGFLHLFQILYLEEGVSHLQLGFRAAFSVLFHFFSGYKILNAKRTRPWYMIMRDRYTPRLGD